MAKLLSDMNRAVAELIGRGIELLYIAPIDKIVSRQMLRYVVCGVMNYIVLNAVLYHIIYNYVVAKENMELLRIIISPHVATLMVTFPITFLAGFWLNRYVAFRSTENTKRKQMKRYVATIAGSFVISCLILKVLVEYFGIWPTPANVATSLLTSIYSYLMARFFTFRVSKKEQG